MGYAAVKTLHLIMSHKNLKELSAQVGTGLGYLEDSASGLEAQLDSLAKDFLQDSRGLNLLFMRQGCLCIPGENCCFYAHQS